MNLVALIKNALMSSLRSGLFDVPSLDQVFSCACIKFALSFGCPVSVNVLWLFLLVPLVGLQCVILVFPDQTHFLQPRSGPKPFDTSL